MKRLFSLILLAFVWSGVFAQGCYELPTVSVLVNMYTTSTDTSESGDVVAGLAVKCEDTYGQIAWSETNFYGVAECPPHLFAPVRFTVYAKKYGRYKVLSRYHGGDWYVPNECTQFSNEDQVIKISDWSKDVYAAFSAASALHDFMFWYLPMNGIGVPSDMLTVYMTDDMRSDSRTGEYDPYDKIVRVNPNDPGGKPKRGYEVYHMVIHETSHWMHHLRTRRWPYGPLTESWASAVTAYALKIKWDYKWDETFPTVAGERCVGICDQDGHNSFFVDLMDSYDQSTRDPDYMIDKVNGWMSLADVWNTMKHRRSFEAVRNAVYVEANHQRNTGQISPTEYQNIYNYIHGFGYW